MKKIALFGGPGSGKCLGIDTPILMYDGSIKKVQDVVTGDQLMGPDSTARNVLSLARGREHMYKIIPIKGNSYIVNESHILSLRMSKDKCGSKQGEVVNISIKDYFNKPKSWIEAAKGWRTGVKFEEQYTPVDPYFLGHWLGDGHSDRASITTMDQEIVDEIKSFAKNYTNHTITQSNSNTGQATTYTIQNIKNRNNNLCRNDLDFIGVLGNKHVPAIYKCNSTSARLEVLAGLMDSDGSLYKDCYDYISKLEVLANDVMYLARSVGLAAYMKPCRKECTNTGVWGDYFRVSISGHTDMIPCRLSRKQASPRKHRKNVLNVGIQVEKIEVDDYYGFEIDGDHLFMLGDFTVTHNTTQGLSFTAYMKSLGFNFHYVSEYARDFIDTYGAKAINNTSALIQKYILEKQIRKEQKLPECIDGYITDSPVFIAWIYTAINNKIQYKLDTDTYIALKDCYKGFLKCMAEYTHIVHVLREKDYIEDGTRAQSEEEAKKIDRILISLLELHNIEYHTISGTTEERNEQLKNTIGA